MKLFTLLGGVAAIVLGALPLTASAYVKNEITQVDAAAGSLTINSGQGGFSTFRTTPDAEIILNGEKSALKSLAPGMTAAVTSASGVASRIVATTGSGAAGSDGAGLILKDAKYHVMATSSRTKPVIVGFVKAGQKVTIVPTRVRWCGGGSKKGVYCDWNGYLGKTAEGHPWMALIASVERPLFHRKTMLFL